MAAELVGLKVDVIVTVSGTAAVAAQRATTDTPIVFTYVPDPVALGLVNSLGRPGGNITGVATLQEELTAKRLEFLKAAVPSLKSVVILTHSENPAAAQQAKDAAVRAGLEARVVVVRDPNELATVVATSGRPSSSAVVLMPDPFIYVYRSRIADLAIARRQAVVGWQRHLAENGALISYGANPVGISHRAAYYVDRILKGVKSADLPVEQPTKFELVINLKTAKAIGLTIPQSLLVRADEIIQ